MKCMQWRLCFSIGNVHLGGATVELHLGKCTELIGQPVPDAAQNLVPEAR